MVTILSRKPGESDASFNSRRSQAQQKDSQQVRSQADLIAKRKKLLSRIESAGGQERNRLVAEFRGLQRPGETPSQSNVRISTQQPLSAPAGQNVDTSSLKAGPRATQEFAQKTAKPAQSQQVPTLANAFRLIAPNQRAELQARFGKDIAGIQKEALRIANLQASARGRIEVPTPASPTAPANRVDINPERPETSISASAGIAPTVIPGEKDRASRFSQMDSRGLFEQIKSGSLIPSKSDPVWGGLNIDGMPTNQQIEAFNLWENHLRFRKMNSNELFLAIKKGEITPDKGNFLWNSLNQGGQANNVQVAAFSQWEQFLTANPDFRRATSDPTSIQSIRTISSTEQAEDIVNKFQQDGVEQDEAISTRGEQKPKEETPAAELITEDKSLEQKLLDVRSEFGMDALDQRLADWQANEDEVLASRERRTRFEQGATVPLGVIQGRVNEIEQQENQRLNHILQQKNGILRQINSNNSVINRRLGLAQADQEFKYNNTFKEANLRIAEGRLDLAIQGTLRSLPEGRSMTIDGTTYTGMKSNSAANITKVTRPNGEVVLMGVDPNGSILFTTSLGRSRIPRTGGGVAADASFVKLLKEQKAISEIEFRKLQQEGNIFRLTTDESIKDFSTPLLLEIARNRARAGSPLSETRRINEDLTELFLDIKFPKLSKKLQNGILKDIVEQATAPALVTPKEFQ